MYAPGIYVKVRHGGWGDTLYGPYESVEDAEAAIKANRSDRDALKYFVVTITETGITEKPA